MKKLLLIVFLLCLFSNKLISQDTIRIKHTNYTTIYSKKLHYPVLVEWWETKAKNDCEKPLPRKDQFAPDPQQHDLTDVVKDYIGSGVDRGHMCPAASNECMTPLVLTECFYMSNMSGQYHSLNAGDWKTLETLSRNLSIQNDSIHVWAGSVGIAKTFGTHNIAIPIKCWKVIYILKTKEWMAFEFNNDTSKPIGLNAHRVEVQDIQKLSGFSFH